MHLAKVLADGANMPGWGITSQISSKEKPKCYGFKSERQKFPEVCVYECVWGKSGEDLCRWEDFNLTS